MSLAPSAGDSGAAMSKIQLKVMGTLTLLIVVVVGTSGFLAERGLRERTTINARIFHSFP